VSQARADNKGLECSKNMDLTWALALVPFLSGGLGAYFGGYLKQKGENLAKKEDLDHLIQEVAVVTQTTKEIENKLSDEVWNRQRRWELKREAVFEFAKRAAGAKDAVTSLYATYKTDKQSKNEGGEGRLERQNLVAAAFGEAANRLDEAFLRLDVVCGKDLVKTAGEFLMFIRTLGGEIMNGNPEKFDSCKREFGASLNALNVAMKKEMGL
jgi:hypothetical protein